MTTNFSISNLPAKYAAKVHEIAIRNGMSDEEVVGELMHTFLDLAENSQDEDDSGIARRLRGALREKFGIGSD
jgi:tRNA 2-selenouridine synthase SelU